VAPVHQHHRLAVARGVRGCTGITAQRVQDETFHLVCGKRLDGFTLTPAVIAKVEQHEQIPGFLAGFFCTAKHRHRKRVGHVGDNQANQSRAPTLERLRHRTGAVSQRCDRDFHACGDFRREQFVAVVQKSGNRGLGDARLARNIRNGGARIGPGSLLKFFYRHSKRTK